MAKLQIPDFTEDMVSLMIQIMLTVPRFPRAPFALVPLSKKDEVIYGADAYIESIRPLYIQFKRSFAYPDSSHSRIITDRKTLKAGCSPQVLFFDLRDKKPTHPDYQHNILYDLRMKLTKSGTGNAFYTAPLFLQRSAYLMGVHLASMLSWGPWNWFRSDPFFAGNQHIITSSGTIRFQNIPILKEHVVIPPHVKVKTCKHRYSYLENGKEVCFHDPTNLGDLQSLGDTVYDFMKFSDGVPTTVMTGLRESLSLLNELRGIPNETTQLNRNESVIEQWVAFGEHLRNDYDIYQFLLLKLTKNY